MDWLRKLPDAQRSAPGLEWALWRRLPAIAFWGTALPGLLALAVYLLAPAHSTPGEQRAAQLIDFILVGVVALHWTVVATVAVGCVAVMVMKGPAYVADAYHLDGRAPPPG